MAYRLHAFGPVVLPLGVAEQDLSTGKVDSALVDVVSGVADVYGWRQRLPRKQTINHTGMYVGELTNLVTEAGAYLVTEGGNRLIAGDAETMLRGQVDALKAMHGQRSYLYRRREDDGVVQWKLARLLQVQHSQNGQNLYGAKLSSAFETIDAGWRSFTQQSAAAAFADGAYLLVQNRGNLPVDDAVITVTAATTITNLAIAGPGIDLRWTGSLTPGQVLSIDCNGKTVTTGGANSYVVFSLGSEHTQPGWLPLAVGDTLLRFAGSGSGTVAVIWYDRFI